jgi:hypothetical protein
MIVQAQDSVRMLCERVSSRYIWASRGGDYAHVAPLGSRRQRPDRGYGLKLDINPYDNGLSVVSS